MSKALFSTFTLGILQQKAHTTGRIIMMLLMGCTWLHADDFSYSFHVDNAQPYVKEAVILTFDVKQTNHDIVLLFDFDLLPSKAYSFQRIGIKEVDAYHAVEIQYTYLVYPLKSTTVDIRFKLTQKATTDESVAYSFSGDRDNVKTLETQDSKISLPPLKLQVKPLPLGTALVGDFSLDYKVKTLEATSYEPLPLQVSIKGLGYPPLLDALLPKDVNFTTFTESPLVDAVASKDGTQTTVVYPMALSHSKSFTLQAIDIKAFEPKTKRIYTLHIPAQHFTVTAVEKSTLLDKTDMPAQRQADWSWLQTFLGYLVVFVSGYFTSTLWNNKLELTSYAKEQHPLVQKIQDAQTGKLLLQILLSQDAKQFTIVIEKLEAFLYGNSNTNLKILKKDALEILT